MSEKTISQGIFGCVYYPKIKCIGDMYGDKMTKEKKKSMISKFTKYNYIAKNEYLIGQKIKKGHLSQDIDPYIFVFVEQLCILENSKKTRPPFHDDNDCKLSVKDTFKYCILYSKYFESKPLIYFFKNNFSLEFFNKTYNFLLLATSFLYEKYKIIHMDLHFSNILYDVNNQYHIIDFGLSIDLNKALTNEFYLKSLLLGYNKKNPAIQLPIEIYILIFFLKKNKKITKTELTNIVRNYYKTQENQFKKLKNFYKIFLYDKNINDYIEEVAQYYTDKFVNNSPIKFHIDSILKESSFSWDLYRISVFVMLFIDIYNIEIIPESTLQFIKQSIHYDYKMRPRALDIIKSILNI